MTTFLMVDVESITSSIPRSNFLETDLDLIADMILESKGILKPLVLKKIGFEQYEVVDGHFEYYAAVRAREKNPSEGETVNSLIVSSVQEKAVLKQAAALKSLEYIVKPENEEVIKEQISIIRKQGEDDNNKPQSENSYPQNIKSITDKVEQLTRNFKKIDEIDSKQTNTQNKLEVLSDKIDIVDQAVKRIEDMLTKLLETGFGHISPPSEFSIEVIMTVPQLRVKAKERNITGYSKMKKNDLIVALKEIGAI